MKIRADFVTNSSSSSFTIIGMDSPMVDQYLKENPLTFTPVTSGEYYGTKFSEQPTKTYTSIKELLSDIAKAQDYEIEIDEDLDEMHMQVPQDETWAEEQLSWDLECAWELYAEENDINEDDYEAEFLKFSSEYLKNHDYPAEDFLRRISYEYLDEISDYDPSERAPQLAQLKEYIQKNRKEFLLQSGCLYVHILMSQGGMTGWIDLTAYYIRNGVPQYLHQEYYSPSQWDYCPMYMTRSERHDLISRNLETLDSFLCEWPDELAKVREHIGKWLDYAWRSGINSFVLRVTVIKKIKTNSIDFKDIPAIHKKDEEVLLLCIENDIKGTKLPKNIINEMNQYLYPQTEKKRISEVLIKQIKQNPEILHEAFAIIDLQDHLKKIEKNWKAIFKVPEEIKDNRHLLLAALLSYAKRNNIDIKPTKEIDKELILDLFNNSTATNIRYLMELLPDEYLQDQEIYEIALKKKVFEALRFSPKETVMEYLKKRGTFLKYASDELRADKEAVLTAVRPSYIIGGTDVFGYASEELKADPEFVLEAMKKNHAVFRYADEKLRFNREFVLKAVRLDGFVLYYVSDELKGDREIVFEAVRKNSSALIYASKELKDDREIALEAVRKSGHTLSDVSEELKGDREIVLEAVRQDGWSLRYASEKLKGDREIALEAVKQSCHSLQHASDELRNDREVVLEAVRQNGVTLEYASDELRNDREVVLEAVRQDVEALGYASEKLKGDREIVLEAVKQKCHALQYASEELKGDQEFVLEAIKNGSWAFQYASDELRADQKTVLEVVRQSAWAFQYASDELRADRKTVLEAVRQDGMAFQYASDELRADREVTLDAVRQNGMAFQYASDELRADREIVLEAVRNYGYALRYASEELQSDREIVLVAVRNYGYAFEFASEDIKNDRKIVLEVVRQYGPALNSTSNELKADREIVLEAVRNSGYALKFASEELKGDREIVLEAVRQDGMAFQYASDELRADREMALMAVKADRHALRYVAKSLRNDPDFKTEVNKIIRSKS